MKCKKLFPRIPRSVRAIINLVLAIVFAAVFYLAIGCPTLSFTQEFRRAERAHMVGRSKIVDHIRNHQDYDKMLIAETEHGVCFFGRFEVITGHNQKEHRYSFTYYEKTGDVTVAVAPTISGSVWNFPGFHLPIYVFDDHPEAVRAEIKTTVSGNYSYSSDGKNFTVPFTEPFTAEANRSGDGYFRFTLKSDDEMSARALGLLSDIASGGIVSSSQQDTVIPFTVRLYDGQDQLILEKNLEIKR